MNEVNLFDVVSAVIEELAEIERFAIVGILDTGGIWTDRLTVPGDQIYCRYFLLAYRHDRRAKPVVALERVDRIIRRAVIVGIKGVARIDAVVVSGEQFAVVAADQISVRISLKGAVVNYDIVVLQSDRLIALSQYFTQSVGLMNEYESASSRASV